MADSFIIKSVKTDAVLEFSNLRADYVTVAFHSETRRAVRDVYLYGDISMLASLFDNMAKNWRGWEGKLSWISLEAEFALYASSDGLGHVALEVELGANESFTAEPWYFKGFLMTEAGQLDALAKNAKLFFVDSAK